MNGQAVNQVNETVNMETRENEQKEAVNKRIVISKNTYKKLNIIKTLLDESLQNMQEKDLLGYIIDKAVDFYYKSDEIQKQLLGL